ncbi:MAG: phenylacetic acid degradation protein [Armatimonadetes bacterium]|nr:phenylacetic acid degradation protein [Armatimonadota bacterium]
MIDRAAASARRRVLVVLAQQVWAHAVLEYVNAPDDAYAWEKVDQQPLAGGAVITNLKLTSQVWQGITWTHRVQVLTPARMTHPETAVLLITGGTASSQELMFLGMIAEAVGAPMVVLGDIPNQPLFDDLHEDALIAYTFVKCLETGDTTWPLLFPMTKAAVRAMDMVEEYTAEEWDTPVTSFVVTGASKRGWTTWFTGAVAPGRIKGIAPMVYDNLDLPAQMRHQVEAWGDYSEQIHDYTELGILDMLHSEAGLRLSAMVDPYSLRRRITMPKLTITGTNDPYWPLDSANLYFDAMSAPNYILYVPNSGHGLEDITRVISAQTGFFLACTGRVPLPQPEWEFEEGRYLKLHITSDPTPKKVTQWTAYSTTRDFRGAKWHEDPAMERNGQWLCRLLYPDEGYAAVFGEVTYEVDGRDFPLSTNVRIISTRNVQ